jgi:hypothetical protein
MAREQIAPKADQPRVTTGDIARKSEPAKLEYRVSIKSMDRSPGKRNYGRSVRG